MSVKSSFACAAIFLHCLIQFSSTIDAAQPLPRAHSHNDYRHQRPFWDAHEQGFCSFEVDIYRVGDELYVAHNRIELLQKKKLTDLYLDPLLKVVKSNEGQVYKEGPETVILLIDIKSDGVAVFSLLKETLAKYREMISCMTDGVYHQRAVQIIISGDRPKDLIQNDTDQMMSIDGRPSDLQSELSPELMPLISDQWGSQFKWRGRGEMPEDERKKLLEMVRQCHDAGRKLRFWASPESKAVWKELVSADVDLINTDKLEELNRFLTDG